jgi:TP901 family phage tail tape measure protein
MAERSVSVRLLANTTQYEAALKRAQSTTTGLATSAGSSFARVGAQMQNVGRSMTRYVTLPVAAVGVAATKMAMDFESAFAQMVGLAGVSADEVDGLKESVLGLAGKTGRAPLELARALYFASSAGLDTADAMDAVDVAAHAAASGMGTTEDVVGLVASAMASYGAANITAAEATDILTATIREGRAEPAELAGALGTVLPIAAQLGIGFEEVGGATAYMSNVFGDTEETVVRLNGFLRAMLNPSQEGAKALEEMGGSAQELRAAISQDGLQGALQYLRDHGFADNEEALGNLFSDSRALQGALVLLNDESGRLDSTMAAVADSSGALGDAFSVTAETGGFKMRQALAEIQAAMIQVGDILLPIAAQIGSAVADLVGWFSNLPGPVLDVVVALGGLAAVGGPAIYMAGTLLKSWKSLSGAFTGGAGAMSKAAGALGAVGLAATVGFLGYQMFTAEQRKTEQNTRQSTAALDTQFTSLLNAAVAAATTAEQIDAVALANEALSLAIAEGNDELAKAASQLNVSGDQLLDVLVLMDSDSASLTTTLDFLARSFGLNAEQADFFARNYSNLISPLGGTREAAREAGAEIGITGEQFDALTAATTRFFNVADNTDVQQIARDFLDARVSAFGYEDSLVSLAAANTHQNRATGDALAVYREWVRLMAEADPATRAVAGVTDDMADAIAGLPPELEDAADATDELAKRQASSIDTMSNYQSWMEEVNQIVGAYTDALDTALGSGREWIRAHDDFSGALIGFSDQVDDSTAGLDYNTEAGLSNRDAIYEMADGLIDLTQSNLEAGKSQAETSAEYTAGRDALLDAAEAAGLNRDEVDDLITAYGLVPELVTTTVNLANDALSKWRIDRYVEKLDEIDPTIATAIEVAIDNNDWAEANRLLNSIVDPVVNVRVSLPRLPRIIQLGGGQVGYDTTGGRGPIALARGGYIGQVGPAGIPAVVHSDEVMLPLTDPARMSALLGLSAVGPRVAAAMGSWMSYTPTPAADLPPINVYNNGREITPADIAMAIRMSRTAA